MSCQQKGNCSVYHILKIDGGNWKFRKCCLQLQRNSQINTFLEENISVVFDVEDGSKLFEELKKKKIDVILLDLEMPVLNGHQALKILSERYPQVKVIVISTHYSDVIISESIANGANAFLSKNADIDRVIDAIYAVHEQGYYFDDKVSRALLKRINDSEKRKLHLMKEILTKCERQIVELICAGKTN